MKAYHDTGGKWIERQYRDTLRALGIIPKRKSNVRATNLSMSKILENFKCLKCRGELKQVRSGAKKVFCINCATKYEFKKRKPKRNQEK